MTRFNAYLNEAAGRNIVNTKELKATLEYFTRQAQGEEFDNDVYDWIQSNLKNYFLRDYDNLIEVDPKHITFGDVNGQPWIAKAIERKEKLHKINFTIAFENKILHVLDYFNAHPDLRLDRISVPEAIRQSEEWTKKLNKKQLDDEDPAGIKEIRKYPTGFRWVKVTSKKSLDREGSLMKHCVGSYAQQVASGRTEIYSLRDKKNEPHCTMEIKGSEINQIKGKSNGPIDKKYLKYVLDILNKPFRGDKWSVVRDLQNLDLVEIKGKFKTIKEIGPEDRKTMIDAMIDFLYSYLGSGTGRWTDAWMYGFLIAFAPNDRDIFNRPNPHEHFDAIRKNLEKAPLKKIINHYVDLCNLAMDDDY